MREGGEEVGTGTIDACGPWGNIGGFGRDIGRKRRQALFLTASHRRGKGGHAMPCHAFSIVLPARTSKYFLIQNSEYKTFVISLYMVIVVSTVWSTTAVCSMSVHVHVLFITLSARYYVLEVKVLVVSTTVWRMLLDLGLVSLIIPASFSGQTTPAQFFWQTIPHSMYTSFNGSFCQCRYKYKNEHLATQILFRGKIPGG